MNSAHRTETALKRLFDEVVREATTNPGFASRLAHALGQATRPEAPKRSHRRAPGVVDPFAAFTELGEEGLRRSLASLSVEQLKDIVAQHGMDRSKLAMKWKTPDRFVELVVETVTARSRKGDAFR